MYKSHLIAILNSLKEYVYIIGMGPENDEPITQRLRTLQQASCGRVLENIREEKPVVPGLNAIYRAPTP